MKTTFLDQFIFFNNETEKKIFLKLMQNEIETREKLEKLFETKVEKESKRILEKFLDNGLKRC